MSLPGFRTMGRLRRRDGASLSANMPETPAPDGNLGTALRPGPDHVPEIHASRGSGVRPVIAEDREPVAFLAMSRPMRESAVAEDLGAVPRKVAFVCAVQSVDLQRAVDAKGRPVSRRESAREEHGSVFSDRDEAGVEGRIEMGREQQAVEDVETLRVRVSGLTFAGGRGFLNPRIYSSMNSLARMSAGSLTPHLSDSSRWIRSASWWLP